MLSSASSSSPPLSPLTPDFPSSSSFPDSNTNSTDLTMSNDPVAGRLPPEIIERILQHVAISYLPNCCLVNKLWLQCARPFLWRTISPEDIYDEDFITQFANNYQHVRDLRVFVPCDTEIHKELLKPSPTSDPLTRSTPSTATTTARASTTPGQKRPLFGAYDDDDDDDGDDYELSVSATKTLLDCHRLTDLHVHYSATLINTLPHFRDAPHRPNVAPDIRLMITSAEKIVENNVKSLRCFRVSGLCFPVGKPILKLIEKMTGIESLSFQKWVDYEGEEFFRLLLGVSPKLEDLSIEMTDLTGSHSAIVLLYGWRHIYDEHQKLAGKSPTVQQSTTAAATGGSGAGTDEEGENEDEDWIPGTRTTPSFAVTSAKTIAGERRLDRLTNIKSLSLNRSTINTQFLLRMGAVMPELKVLSLKQIYGIELDDDMHWEGDPWDMDSESDGEGVPDFLVNPLGAVHTLGAGSNGQGLVNEIAASMEASYQASLLAGSGAVPGEDVDSDEEPGDLPDLVPATDEPEDMPDHPATDEDEDLPDLEPATGPLHVVNADASSEPTQQSAGPSNQQGPSIIDLDEGEDMDDDDEEEDDDMYDDPYENYSEDDDYEGEDDDIWGIDGAAMGGPSSLLPFPSSVASLLAQNAPVHVPQSHAPASALSKAFRTLHPLCPKIDTFEFSGSRSEALNEKVFDVICELWGGPDADVDSATFEQSASSGLKVLNAGDVCKVEAKFFTSIRQRCSSTLTSLDLSLSPKMMWELRSVNYEMEVRQGMYYDEILQLLMTCPTLQHLLVGPYPVNGRTIAAQESDWIASGLRSLQICIEFDAPPATVSKDAAEEEICQIRTRVCQQLGRLSWLEHLTLVGGRPVSTDSAGERVMDSVNVFGGYTRGVSRPGSNETPRKYIDLSLSSGLAHLAGLERLETLDVVFLGPHGLRQDAELGWVMSHWPKLHTVSGFWDRAKLRALVRQYREDLKTPANTPASGPGAYLARRRREQGVRLRPELELEIDPKVKRLNGRGVRVDTRLLDSLLLDEGMETQAVVQEGGIHKMYSPGVAESIEAKKAEKAKAKAEAKAATSNAADVGDQEKEGDNEGPADDDGDENYMDMMDSDVDEDADEDGSESEDEDEPGVTRFNWYVRYIGGAEHAPWDAGHGGIRNGELMTEVMRPREGRSPSPLATWY
ncbi:hypothetical protein BGX23_004883 [Mortierella sp. AD031]|nr:hypothetical protein BGX23_004883 [Mortierella sp. AD031]